MQFAIYLTRPAVSRNLGYRCSMAARVGLVLAIHVRRARNESLMSWTIRSLLADNGMMFCNELAIRSSSSCSLWMLWLRPAQLHNICIIQWKAILWCNCAVLKFVFDNNTTSARLIAFYHDAYFCRRISREAKIDVRPTKVGRVIKWYNTGASCVLDLSTNRSGLKLILIG